MAEWVDEFLLLAYRDGFPCGGILPQLGYSWKYHLDRDVYSYRSSAGYPRFTRYSLYITLAGNLFDVLDSLCCLFLRSTSYIYFGIMFQ